MARAELPPSLVTPSRKQRSQDASRTLGVAAGCAVALLVAVVCLSSGTSSPSSLVARAGEYEYVPLEGMPDPDKAVFNAQRSVGQVSPFHSNGATAAVEAAEMTGGDEVPKMVTSPRYAATLGQEAATHALSQPFEVPLERDGQEVPGAVAPNGLYAPITPAYSNPLAQYIPNVTYYEVGSMGPGTRKGGHSHKFFNAFTVKDDAEDEEEEEEAAGGDDEAETQEAAQVAPSGSSAGGISGALSRLYGALATKEAVVREDVKRQAAIRAAIERLQGRVSGSAQPMPGMSASVQYPRKMVTVSPVGPQY